jgi:hypothetical protein
MDIIRYIGTLDLDLDQSYRGDCPKCGGKNTFTATRSIGKLLYNCYKAGCSLSGTKNQRVSIKDLTNNTTSDASNFEMPKHIIPAVSSTKNSPTFETFSSRYGLCLNSLDVYYDLKEHRIVFPIVHDYKIVDAVGRTTNSKISPKWRRYGASGYGYKVGEGNIVVLVEDCISASVVAQEFTNCVGFALLGTTFLNTYCKQLEDVDTIIIALDPDANNKSLELKRQLSSYLDAKIFSFKLEDDLKYRNKYDINRLEEKFEILNGRNI